MCINRLGCEKYFLELSFKNTASMKDKFYFLLQKHAMLWEQEIYNNFKYNTPRPHFHSFEANVSFSSFCVNRVSLPP